MSTLAAQSRFVHGQRRMELPLGELPAELFHRLIGTVQTEAQDAAALRRLQAGYDEATGRLGLLARLVAAMRRGRRLALSGLVAAPTGSVVYGIDDSFFRRTVFAPGTDNIVVVSG